MLLAPAMPDVDVLDASAVEVPPPASEALTLELASSGGALLPPQAGSHTDSNQTPRLDRCERASGRLEAQGGAGDVSGMLTSCMAHIHDDLR